MAACALIQLDESGVNGTVVNTIVADPSVDAAPPGCVIVIVPTITTTTDIPVYQTRDDGSFVTDSDGKPIQAVDANGVPVTITTTTSGLQGVSIGWTYTNGSFAAPGG